MCSFRPHWAAARAMTVTEMPSHVTLWDRKPRMHKSVDRNKLKLSLVRTVRDN